MKIAVKDLQPNPFRKIKTYPISREKINALKISIHETTFWDNIVARKNNGKFEIAYGHHRLIALKELGLKDVDIPVRRFDDAMMIKIMANENLDDWSLRPAVINETVLVAKEFLDNRLARYETWQDIRSDKSIRTILGIENGQAFAKLKGTGVGRDTILKFLGGNWKGWHIQEALGTLKDKTIDRIAIETLPTLEQARVFKDAVKTYKIPKIQQKQLAERIVKEVIGKRAIKETVRTAKALSQIAPKKSKQPPWVGKFIMDCERDTDDLNGRIKKLLPVLDDIPLGGIGILISALNRLCITANKIDNFYKEKRNGKGKKRIKNKKSIRGLIS